MSGLRAGSLVAAAATAVAAVAALLVLPARAAAVTAGLPREAPEPASGVRPLTGDPVRLPG